MMPLSATDLRVLGQELVERLGSFFPCERFAVWLPGEGGSDFPAVEISRRQRERAREALDAGLPYWDLAGATVILPVSLGTRGEYHENSDATGAFILSGVRRNIGADEPERWLPLLASWVRNELLVMRHEMFATNDGAIMPLYLERAVMAKAGNEPFGILHLVMEKMCSQADVHRIELILQGFFRQVSKGVCVEAAGYGNERKGQNAWFVISGQKNKEISPLINRAISIPGLKEYSLREFFWHSTVSDVLDVDFIKWSRAGRTVAENPLKGLESQIACLENTGRALGYPVFSAEMLRDIESRFNCHGLEEVFSCPVARAGAGFAAAFCVLPGSPRIEDYPQLFDEKIVSSTGPVLLLKKVPFSKRSDFSVSSWGREIQEFLYSQGAADSGAGGLSLGCAASWQETLKAATTPGAAFWAYVHAHMLGDGGCIEFDHVTWQVRGDELISSGALKQACRAFRNGLKLSPDSAEIWNSLGVTLASLGRKREARQAFENAASLTPDDFMAHYNLCGIEHGLGNLDAAQAACRRALELSPGNHAALVRMAQVLVDAGKYEEVVNLLGHEFPADANGMPKAAWRLLGIAQFCLGEWSLAKMALEKAIRAKGDDPVARAWLAIGYAEHEADTDTAYHLARDLNQLEGKSAFSPELKPVLARLSAILAESSLDKEKSHG